MELFFCFLNFFIMASGKSLYIISIMLFLSTRIKKVHILAIKYANMSDGVIVGSAIVKIIAEHGENAGKYIHDYVKNMTENL